MPKELLCSKSKKMIFTAFSGGHQDAIKKGLDVHKNTNGRYLGVSYLPIDPSGIKRGFERAVRINSQSGKGDMAFVIKEILGVELSKEESIGFGKMVEKYQIKKVESLKAWK
jgi:2-isopropylmalate synthase